MQIESNGVEITLMPGQLKQIPPQTVRPVDEIQMANVIERALVLSPLRARNANKPVIWAFDRLDHIVTFPEDGRQVRPQRGSVAEVADVWVVRSARVERFGHVLLR